ncbi:MAG: phosphatidate cytidylyltransferase [Bdellovibrionota bacterium]|nr:phosphatidate cytidylyltransferase [Bdellovibrionota bacterium]
MTNTQQRIVSAVALLALFLICMLLGKMGMLFLVGFTGLILVDEINHSMLKISRSHFSYYVAVASYLAGYVFFNFIDEFNVYEALILNAGMTLSSVLVLYLFMEKMESKFFVNMMRKNAYLTGLYVLIPILCFSVLIHQKHWMIYLFLILVLNSSVDIGAWFFGKNFGEKKLWPKISPNKTRFGLLGGVSSSVVLSGIFIYLAFGNLNFPIFFSLIALGLLAQIGDLIESKIKRQLEVKDSSNLIPGHGGIYDRIDSLVFIAPFFAVMVRDLL